MPPIRQGKMHLNCYFTSVCRLDTLCRYAAVTVALAVASCITCLVETAPVTRPGRWPCLDRCSACRWYGMKCCAYSGQPWLPIPHNTLVGYLLRTNRPQAQLSWRALGISTLGLEYTKLTG